MPFKQSNGTRAFQFNLLQSHVANHAIYTRHGGVSPEPWESLNVGRTVGDDPVRVDENRRRVFESYGRSEATLYDVWQVHSAEVVHADKPRRTGSPQKADAIITSNPEITLFMRFADCVPIYLLDPHTPAIGIAHAGWLGTVRRTAEAAVKAMIRTFGSDPKNILGGIGPSIGPDHYEVGPDVIDQFSVSFGRDAARHVIRRDGRTYLNLWSANEHLLHGQGVEAIEIAQICTVCDNSDWYSHRGERGATGRFAALFSLE